MNKKFNEHPIVAGMIEGYGDNFPSWSDILGIKLTPEDIQVLNSPVPDLGRYHKSVFNFKEITSAKAVGTIRFRVICEYFIALSSFLETYNGGRRKILPKLTPKEISIIRKIGTDPVEIKMAEKIEQFSDHDTAAAVDYVKLRIAEMIPRLRDYIEAVHFANTSEDVMGNVFGIIGNNLIYGVFMPKLIEYCRFLLEFSSNLEDNGPLVLPAFTHEQCAEPTSWGKKTMFTIATIEYLVENGLYNKGGKGFQSFSGKLGGGSGNLLCHFAAYPELEWWKFAEKFVTDLGLYYEPMTHQSVSYVVEAQIFTTISNILGQILKSTDDFIKMARCPGQLFVKRKKKGQKGSSVFPNKSNAWGMEGAIKMIKKSRSLLLNLAQELPDFPDEGNMGRSYLFRDIGTAFMPIVIGLNRIMREMKSYHPNQVKIDSIFYEYPGMAGSAIQTVLKREGVEGDAYRAIQDISINKDGRYANNEEFMKRLKEKIAKFNLSLDAEKEILSFTNPANLIGPVHRKVESEMKTKQSKLKHWEDASSDMIS